MNNLFGFAGFLTTLTLFLSLASSGQAKPPAPPSPVPAYPIVVDANGKFVGYADSSFLVLMKLNGAWTAVPLNFSGVEGGGTGTLYWASSSCAGTAYISLEGQVIPKAAVGLFPPSTLASIYFPSGPITSPMRALSYATHNSGCQSYDGMRGDLAPAQFVTIISLGLTPPFSARP